VQNQKLVLFDFDGVIVDGMNEYWYSSLMVCKKYLNSDALPINLNIDMKVSNTFKEVRPWVKYGWEMVLLTHEIIKKNKPLDHLSKKDFLNNYPKNCKDVLTRNSWEPDILQLYLDKVRQSQIKSDLDKWINFHNPFFKVISFIKKAQEDGFKIGIISTKSSKFTSKILNSFNVYPELIFGYEAGTKVKIISNLIKEYEIIGFIEDRKKTLLNITGNNKTNKIRCFLADWGYLKESDRLNLPRDIILIKLKDLKNILANSN
tara:strand:+ start:1432 stop:2214 length:783 start_codon:yes stop_codon:yes gene_type:complete